MWDKLKHFKQFLFYFFHIYTIPKKKWVVYFDFGVEFYEQEKYETRFSLRMRTLW